MTHADCYCASLDSEKCVYCDRGESRTRYVNAYAVGLCYGGPEEGGWYYDIGTPLESVRVHGSWSDANEARETLRAKLESDYARGHNRYSVLGGDDLEIGIEDAPGEAYPTERPYYC